MKWQCTGCGIHKTRRDFHNWFEENFQPTPEEEALKHADKCGSAVQITYTTIPSANVRS